MSNPPRSFTIPHISRPTPLVDEVSKSKGLWPFASMDQLVVGWVYLKANKIHHCQQKEDPRHPQTKTNRRPRSGPNKAQRRKCKVLQRNFIAGTQPLLTFRAFSLSSSLYCVSCVRDLVSRLDACYFLTVFYIFINQRTTMIETDVVHKHSLPRSDRKNHARWLKCEGVWRPAHGRFPLLWAIVQKL